MISDVGADAQREARAQEADCLIRERDRYKLERDALLAALFTSCDNRLHLSATLLGADSDGKSELDSGSDIPPRRTP